MEFFVADNLVIKITLMIVNVMSILNFQVQAGEWPLEFTASAKKIHPFASISYEIGVL